MSEENHRIWGDISFLDHPVWRIDRHLWCEVGTDACDVIDECRVTADAVAVAVSFIVTSLAHSNACLATLAVISLYYYRCGPKN